MKKTLGQIAHEAGEKAGGWLRKWKDMGEAQRADWEAIAEAVAELVAAKAGEVMRERAIQCFFPFGIKADEKIRALPGVTLEDVK